MQRKIKALLLTIIAHVFFMQLQAQRIDSTLAVYADRFQQERMYIQFDKPVYSSGETIWFKAYLMAGINPSDISKNLFVDFSDVDGNLLSHTVFPIIESSAKGQYVLPAEYNGGYVHVKAYTQWMMNFDTAFVFNKDIRTLQKTLPKNPPKQTITASVQFFPEGGDAVSGIRNKIAFKANDQFGRPVNIKGVVLNSKNAVVDTIKAVHDGMGFFYLEPKADETYTAKWTDEQQGLHQTPLPAIKPAGVSLQVKVVPGRRNFTITRSENAPDNFRVLHIAATMHQNLVYLANVSLRDITSLGGSIPIKDLPTGVIQVTLFDSSWAPVAERISFINNHEAVFAPEVGFTTLGLNKRGRNVIEINMPDTISANLSVSVTDAGIGIDSTDNIISHLLLTGDLKGRVFKPSYYFADESDSLEQHLDLVMLSHGWRRFNWMDVVQGKLPVIKYPKDSSYLYFSGKVYNVTPAQLREAGDLLMILRAKDSSSQTLILPISSTGTFIDTRVMLFDTVKVYYQFVQKKNLTDITEVRFFNSLLQAPMHVNIDKSSSGYSQYFDTTGNYRNRYLADQQARLEELLKTATLKEVIVKTRTKSPLEVLDDKYASGMFKGSDAYQFDVAGDIAAQASQNVFNYLQGRVAGLQINTTGSQPSLQWRGSTPQVYLDEMPVDVSTLSNMNMQDVAYIKVLRPPFMGGFGGGAGGAIAVYTRKGGDVKREPGKGLPYKIVAGYTLMKDFYVPNYATFDPRNDKQDLRTTLYWNPYVLTTYENHIIKLTFFNNDISDGFRVVVEGMSKDGKLTRVEKLVQ